MKRILFLCSRNKLRSPTAEVVFADWPGVEADSAGLSDDAEVPLSSDQVEWADLILVMEKIHRDRLNQRFGNLLAGKRVAVLGIPDDYEFMDPKLVDLLKVQMHAVFTMMAIRAYYAEGPGSAKARGSGPPASSALRSEKYAAESC